jgi:ketosteroid isomerase-like protein
LARAHARQASGVQLKHTSAWVVDLKDGRMIRWRECFDRAEALEAVGLRE